MPTYVPPANPDAPPITREMEIESLAQAIHQGDWMMVASE
jgi:hypothetical protein